MIASRQVKEVVRRVLVTRRQSHDDRAAQRIVARFQRAVLRIHLDVAREETFAPRGPDDRFERVRGVREDRIEPLDGAGRPGVADAVELKSRPCVHANQR